MSLLQLKGRQATRIITGDLGIATEWAQPASDALFGRARWLYAEWSMRVHGLADQSVTTMCAVMTHLQTNLVLCHIDTEAVARYTDMGLPPALGIRVHTAFPLAAETEGHVREVMHWLARSAVCESGPPLEIRPTTPTMQQEWAMMADLAVRHLQAGGDLAQLVITVW